MTLLTNGGEDTG